MNKVGQVVEIESSSSFTGVVKQEPFVVGIKPPYKKRRCGLVSNAIIPFDFAGGNFRKNFLPCENEMVHPIELRPYTLQKSVKDDAIIGRDPIIPEVVVTPGQFLFLISSQQKGSEGPLLVKNQMPNVFYLRGLDNLPWNVSACWSGSEWILRAYPLFYFAGITKGARIFLPADFKIR